MTNSTVRWKKPLNHIAKQTNYQKTKQRNQLTAMSNYETTYKKRNTEVGGVAVTSSLTSFPVQYYFRSAFPDLTHSSASKSVDKHDSYGWKSRILCQNLDTMSTNRVTRIFFEFTLLTICSMHHMYNHHLDVKSVVIISMRRRLTNFFSIHRVQSSSGSLIWSQKLDTMSTNRVTNKLLLAHPDIFSDPPCTVIIWMSSLKSDSRYDVG